MTAEQEVGVVEEVVIDHEVGVGSAKVVEAPVVPLAETVMAMTMAVAGAVEEGAKIASFSWAI